jgi:formylglycine-generating enzyme required for sulfatase activity
VDSSQVTRFIEAVQDLRGCADDEELRGGEVACTSLGLPMLWSGNFADVYKIHCAATGNTWALKCFTRAITGRQERYRQVAGQLEAAALPFTVPFVYLERGIQVRGRWFPAVKMQWVQGQTLNRFVEESLDKPSMLRQLLDLWPKLVARLRDARIAHADLQHGNVLLVPMPDGKLALRLIDYDGMWVPSLAGAPSGELGHPAYQHPQRQQQGTYNAHLDRFSHLVIYTAVHALAAGHGELWQRFNNDENLLFREVDFQCPERSELFQTLWAASDADVHALAGHLVSACTGPLESAAWLDDIVRDGRVAPLTFGQERDVSALMAAGKAAARATPGAAVVPPVPPPGTIPLVVPGTQPLAPPIVVPPVPAVAPRVPARRAGLPLRPLRWFDGLLAALAGKQNEVLHNSLRVVCAVGLLLLVGLTVKMTLPRLGSPVAPKRQPAVSKTEPETASTKQPDYKGGDDKRVIPLRLQPIAPQTVEAGKPLSVVVSVENAPNWEGKFHFSLGANAPSGAAIDPETGAFTWTPPAGEPAGQQEISVSATGREGQTTETSFITTVTRPIPAPAKLPDKKIAVDLGGGVKLEMILVPEGAFLMGSPDSDKDAFGPEKPQHRVRITKPFQLGKYKVTQEQWGAVIGGNPSHFKGPTNPVEQISWGDCQKFLKKLNEKVGGGGFSLPTEAQWEYGCRAGSTTEYFYGDEELALGEYAWYLENSGGRTHPVGEKKPNAWGLHDMNGNVWEWCADWYGAGYYANSPVDNPTGPTTGISRVLRGGGWYNFARLCRSAYRRGPLPGEMDPYVGFRVARVAESLPGAIAVPQPLKLLPIAVQTVEAGKQLTVAVAVESADVWKGKLRYALDPQAPAGAVIDPTMGVLTWTPTQDQDPGKYNLAVSVEGPEGQKESTTVAVTVTGAAPSQNPVSGKEIAVDLGSGVKLEMILIPAGEFLMGSPDSDKSGRSNRSRSKGRNNSDEKPQHRVRFTKPFYLGRYPVTQKQWQAVARNSPNRSRFKGPNNPVDNVSWDDCQAFLGKLNEKFGNDGAKYGLPTEAQWEYACRAGSTTRYYFGDDESMLDEYAWYSKNSGRATHLVGKKTPNAWGLYDIYGNVRQWCADWYDKDYYLASPTDDPKGPDAGSGRVIRGGGWDESARGCRSASRGIGAPLFMIGSLGFRLARVSVEEAPGSLTHAATQESTEAGGKKPITNSVGMKLTLIPAGEFVMGSQRSSAELATMFAQFEPNPELFDREHPQHRVRITRPFYLGAHHVTVGQFLQFVSDAGYRTDAEKGAGASGWDAATGKYVFKAEYSWRNPGFEQTNEHPVVCVSWNDAVAFCQWLTGKEGKQYRLPTEAEWEYACRAGTTTQYWCGDDPEGLAQVANVADATVKAKLNLKFTIRGNDGYTFTSPVGSFRPNPFGLYDMHGNAWQWCADWYDERYYGASPADDPKGPDFGVYHVLRGGSWDDRPYNPRSAERNWYTPDGRGSDAGFRVVRTN